MKLTNFDYIDLAEIEMKRVMNLSLISKEFEERENNDKLPVVMQSVSDNIKAITENEEAYGDVSTGLEYSPVELHMQYCVNAGVEYCVCGSFPLRGVNRNDKAEDLIPF